MTSIPRLIENDLATLSLRAATELDAQLNNEPPKYVYRKAFANLLRNDVQDSEASVRVNLAPTTTKLVARALEEFNSHRASNLRDLHNLVSLFADELANTDDSADHRRLEVLMKICLQLHRQLLAEERYSRIGSRPYSRRW